ncbi:hypothetical protein HMPREF9630_00979 [Peptoanaerobacter stomatis]|uniref:Lipoprotein n=1 Tax=Peptoanaerobacter stomatis TaxID=796937 RepID=V9HTR0_9FIRM|nr:hypothetical protein [Peptoanaerobacter stomatis]EHL14678.1 hypothetical protein HMPREF9630_00979 [Peptoanaerobacter stomatis]
MKKILAMIMLIVLVSSVGCNNSQEKEYNNQTTSQTQNDKENKDEKETENKDKEVNNDTVKTDKVPEKREITALYFYDNSSLIFDKTISEKDLSDYISKETKDEFDKTTLLKLEVEDNKIISLKKQDKAEVMGIYIGLGDLNIAEFSYNLNSFRLEISEEQAEELEKIPENQMLLLQIEKSNQNESNFRLINYSLK